MKEHIKLSQIILEAGTYYTRLTRKFLLRKLYKKHDPRYILAVIPGVITEIDVKAGSRVKRGDKLMILEAMKMHNRVLAPHNGKIQAVRVVTGDKVVKGQILLEMD